MNNNEPIQEAYSQDLLPFPVEDIKVKPRTKPKFSKAKREFVTNLLTPGYYLMFSKRRKRFGYVLYRGNMDPVKWYTEAFIKPFLVLMKINRKNQYTFNLLEVRKEHGKSITKQLYKQLKKNAGKQ